MTVVDLRESTFSTVEQQRERATCAHVWEPVNGRLFGYLPVSARCSVPSCGTYRAPRADDARGASAELDEGGP